MEVREERAESWDDGVWGAVGEGYRVFECAVLGHLDGVVLLDVVFPEKVC